MCLAYYWMVETLVYVYVYAYMFALMCVAKVFLVSASVDIAAVVCLSVELRVWVAEKEEGKVRGG